MARAAHEICTVRADPHTFVSGRDSSKGGAVQVNRVNEASWGQHVGERAGERAIAAPEIGPDRRPERFDATLGKHVNCVAQPHRSTPDQYAPMTAADSSAGLDAIPERSTPHPALRSCFTTQ